MKRFLQCILLFAATSLAQAEEPADTSADETTGDTETPAPTGDGIESPKTMSGMSILGNEEAPKALVIIPWKSSELGDDIRLADSLDDRAQPVDREVFERELRYYAIRSESPHD